MKQKNIKNNEQKPKRQYISAERREGMETYKELLEPGFNDQGPGGGIYISDGIVLMPDGRYVPE